jgi:hypothetical protein
MRRRDLLAVVGGAAAFPTFVAAAADKPFRVGVVSLVNGRSSPQFVAFEQRLRELASATGQDLTIDFTMLDGDAERFAAAMQEQVQRGVDVLLAPGQEVALKAARPRRRGSRSSWSRSITTRSRSAMCRAWRGRVATLPGFIWTRSSLPPSARSY